MSTAVPDAADLAEFEIGDRLMSTSSFRDTQVQYIDPAVQVMVDEFPRYTGRYSASDIGKPVRLKNGAGGILAQSSRVGGKIVPILISPEKDRRWVQAFLSEIGAVTDHQKLRSMKWPMRTDPKFQPKLQAIFKELGYTPDSLDFDPKKCVKEEPKAGQAVALKWYQKCPGAYLVYSRQRGLLVFHGTGTGKTCMAANAIECFIRFHQAEETQKTNSRIFVVIPPRASLDENMRKSLAGICPTLIRQQVEDINVKGNKVDMANRIINKYVTIISYVTLAHRLQKGVMNLEGAILMLDEAHNFLDAKPQYAKEYNYLQQAIRATVNCKIMLMTATPIYKSVSDLSRILNIMRRDNEPPLPQNDREFLQRYFSGSTLKKEIFRKDILGSVSYINLENDLSYFAKKVIVKPVVSRVSDDHYDKWLKSKQNDDAKYHLAQSVSVDDLVLADNPSFKNRETGFFKHSSAVNNTPLTFRATGKWPQKFMMVKEILARHPKGKIFIYSRHKSQGANAVGTYLENELKWDRMSNNRSDHGDKGPTYFNPLSRALAQSPSFDAAVTIRQHVKKPFQGFIVLNSTTSQNEVKRALDLYNHDANLEGEACRVFIGDESFGEGVSLTACTCVVLFEPPYSYQNFQQIVARGVRHCSHKRLPRPWTVNVYTLVSQKDEAHLMTDALLLNYSEKNQKLLQQVIDTVRQGSIEYGFAPVKSQKDHHFGIGVWKILSAMLHQPWRRNLSAREQASIKLLKPVDTEDVDILPPLPDESLSDEEGSD